ncbi:hypothetical protein SAMN05421640_2203 [Ekhidna lutea]|uniref:Uncharacterized protein n=1 Tax=Ekhidna lutea TaxID=447679 RepID=A0A239JJ84_EKHLU|nr:hypothetical protein [Ekhidna lutea]SNT05897.1 hypothetical protein SAMN05421640_2203 [Ekhidna lutea]
MNKIETEINLDELAGFFADMSSNTLRFSNANFSFDISQNKEIRINNPEIVSDHLRTNYFKNLPSEFEIDLEANFNSRIADSGYFSQKQLEFIETMGILMGEVRSSIELQEAIDELRIKLANSKGMTDEEKYEMIALVEYTNSLHQNLINGGLGQIANNILNTENGRILDAPDLDFTNHCPDDVNQPCDTGEGGSSGCSVNWRDVWAGAVVGLTVGATQGAYVGATAGTVTFPVIGTVTGGVSGGVVGGAIGFVSGAATSVAAGLITSCGR